MEIKEEQWKLNNFNLQEFAIDDPDPKDDPDPDPKKDDPDPTPDPKKDDPDPKPNKSFTQEELDAILTRRLSRERKAWETAEAERKAKEAMTETERLKADKEEAEKKSAEVINQANKRLIKAEVKVACVELGIVDADAAYLLMDSKDVEVDEKGDVVGIADALKALAESKPWLIKQSTNTPPGPLNPQVKQPPKDQSKMTDAEWYESRKAKK